MFDGQTGRQSDYYDLESSVRFTTATKLVWLGASLVQNSHSLQKLYNQKNTHFKIPSFRELDIAANNGVTLYKFYMVQVDYHQRKGRDLTQPYDRSPHTDRKIQNAT